MNTNPDPVLRENLENVRARIAAAAARAGRAPGDVALVAITKSVTAEIAAQLFELGVRDLGENRVQELQKKAAAIPAVRWHLVGPLQTNKIRKAILSSHLLHAIDDTELYSSIQRIAAEENRIVKCLLEVNISGEATKHGIVASAAARALEQARAHDRLRIEGLMTMAPAAAGASEIREVFINLRKLRDEAQSRGLFAPGARGELSMGMSNDYEIAVEEGSTLVRVGSALFERLPAEGRIFA